MTGVPTGAKVAFPLPAFNNAPVAFPACYAKP